MPKGSEKDRVMKLTIVLMLLLTVFAFSQQTIRVKPKDANRISWVIDENNATHYGIFWCQGADTTIFPFVNGTDPDSLWENEPITNWSFASVYSNYYYHEVHNMPGVTYIRYGVAPINAAGQYGRIRTYYKVIRVVKPIQLQEIKVD